jgi:hypothetical protein
MPLSPVSVARRSIRHLSAFSHSFHVQYGQSDEFPSLCIALGDRLEAVGDFGLRCSASLHVLLEPVSCRTALARTAKVQQQGEWAGRHFSCSPCRPAHVVVSVDKKTVGSHLSLCLCCQGYRVYEGRGLESHLG